MRHDAVSIVLLVLAGALVVMMTVAIGMYLRSIGKNYPPPDDTDAGVDLPLPPNEPLYVPDEWVNR